MDDLKYFLGIKVVCLERCLHFRKYVFDMLKETDMIGIKLVYTLLDPNVGLVLGQGRH